MGEQVASLTTMNTPHRGCRFVDYACRLPDGFYRFVAGCFDRTFAKFGDKNPDFYTATHQFATKASEEFNRAVPDVPGVYYQSYTSKMRGMFSHLLLSVPYCMIKPLEGDNDGLVSVDSAKWGEFRGVFSSGRLRGISHGDIIDLTRQDYRGFEEGDNDGLVSVDSAKWGEFRGVFSSGRLRGISHGDIIDLTRQDYRGFDVLETYVAIVSELKGKGF